MIKIIPGVLILALLSLSLAAQDTTRKAAEPSTIAVSDNLFCVGLNKILDEAVTGFDAIKGDTVRSKKSIIFTSKLLLDGLNVNRLSMDKASGQTFFRAFLDATGNINSVKRKFEDLKKEILACISDKKWIEKSKETESDTDYDHLVSIMEYPQDNVTKEFKGRLIEIEVEFNKADTDFSIMLNITNYK